MKMRRGILLVTCMISLFMFSSANNKHGPVCLNYYAKLYFNLTQKQFTKLNHYLKYF